MMKSKMFRLLPIALCLNVATVHAATATTASDQEIARKVSEKIGPGWFSNGYDKVSLQVENGTVTLLGYVKTNSDKEKLEREIRNIPGVINLNSQLRTEETYSHDNKYLKEERKYPQDSATNAQDEQLNKKIRDNVSNGWLWDSYKDISIHTNNGDVTVEGTVKEISDQQKILNEIQKIPGVKSVRATLRIQEANSALSKEERKYPQDTASNLADEQLNKKIRDTISSGWLWDSYKDISVHTNNGDVTLEGTVKEMKDQQKILNDIQKIPGVKSVRTHLRVQS